MPEWYPNPDEELKDLLDEVMAALEKEIELNPAFASIVGVDMDRLAEHGQSAVAAMIQGRGLTQRSEILTNPSLLVQLYIFGFVMGKRFGERRAQADDTPSKE